MDIHTNDKEKEKNFGDVFVIGVFRFKDIFTFKGISFLEFKKIKNGIFQEIREDQTERILQNFPRAKFVFIDSQPAYFSINFHLRKSYCVCVNMDIPHNIKIKNRYLYLFGNPISDQIIRYIFGRDLVPLDSTRLNEFKKLLKNRPAKFVIIILSSIGNSDKRREIKDISNVIAKIGYRKLD